MIEVLVVTMGQSDLQLYERMNLQCSCLIANQNGTWGYQENETQFGKVRMISSDTRGVGINRNIALSNAKGDILLFADDDVTYYDGAFEKILQAFEELPDADMIAFNLNKTREGKIVRGRVEETKKRSIFNCLRFGTCRIAIKKKSLQKVNERFNELFGGGCIYGSGEDTLFILGCLRKGLKFYSYSETIGEYAIDTSSWFTGYNDKFYFDKGALICCAFPKMKHFIKYYYAWRFAKKNKGSFWGIVKLLNCGINAFPTLRSFDQETKQK